MNRVIAAICLTAGLTLSATTMAQTTAEDTTTETAAEGTTTTPTAEPTAEPTAPAATEFPTAEEQAEATATVADGQEYVREVQGDWQVRCIKGQEDKTCTLYQLLKDEAGNSVAEFNMVALPKGGKATAGITFISPLGTLLSSQVKMRIDQGKARSYAFNWCEKAGCVARFGLVDADVNALKRGSAATVTIQSIASDKPIPLKLSLTGVTAAWNSISK